MMEAGEEMERILKKRQVVLFFVLLGIAQAGSTLRRYSVEEEAENGFFCGQFVKGPGAGGRETRCAETTSHFQREKIKLRVQ